MKTMTTTTRLLLDGPHVREPLEFQTSRNVYIDEQDRLHVYADTGELLFRSEPGEELYPIVRRSTSYAVDRDHR